MKKRTARCTPYKWRYGILHSRILRFSFFGVESDIDLSTSQSCAFLNTCQGTY